MTDFDEIDRQYAYNGFLGAKYSPESTIFRVWTPLADSVKLKLYTDCKVRDSSFEAEMLKLPSGVWEYEVKDDLNGVYYTYTVKIGGKENETIDIYAKSAGVNGERGMILPEEDNGDRPIEFKHKTDAVIYELHVRDFSADESADFVNRGKFKAFTENNVKTIQGGKAGLDYIADLGVTHIHLLPVADFASVDEARLSPEYNWGYDPLNYNVPEGSYSTDACDGFVRVKELKELIKAVHEKGMGVIMDVVYNHTFQTEDSPFSKIFPHYYYRHDGESYSDGSACGNEFASERKMAGKFIIDSLCYLAREYKLDGFRFDLMGLLDVNTMLRCEEALKKINPSIILYGEGWIAAKSPLPHEMRSVKANADRLKGYSMFSDDFRDSVKGSVFIDEDCGYVNGRAEEKREMIKSALAGGIYHPEVKREAEKCRADSPDQSINYTEAHDNLTFYDKLKASMQDADEDSIKAAHKLGGALIFLSQGVPFIQAGQEFMRSKNGVHDSYKSPDSVNSLKWNMADENRDVVSYYKGLIEIRKAYPDFRMKTADEIRSRLNFTDLENGGIKAEIGEFTLIINPSDEQVVLDVKDSVSVYADKEKASAVPLYTVENKVTAEALSVILFKKISPSLHEG